MTKTSKRSWTYKAPFNIVSQAYQERFSQLPHPRLPNLKQVDYESFEYSVDTHQLQWVILGHVNPPLPRWMKAMSGVKEVIFRSTITLKYLEKELVMQVENQSYRNLLHIKEHNVIRVHPENANWTEYAQESNLTVRAFLGLQGRIESAILNAYGKTYLEARKIDQEFIDGFLAEESIPRRGFVEQLGYETIKKEKPEIAEQMMCLEPERVVISNPPLDDAESQQSGYRQKQASDGQERVETKLQKET